MTLFATIGAHRLLAKYDLIATRHGEATIYDWKTYSRRPTNEALAARWQTRVYRALLARAGAVIGSDAPLSPEGIRMVYWFAEYPGDPAIISYDATQLRADWDAIENLVEEISSLKTFPLTEDRKMCRFCPFRSYCDRGDRASMWEPAAAELDEAETFDVRFDEVEEIAF